MPWNRHTTIGTSQISHSAIQQMSSSWNHGVMRAASQRSQSSTLRELGRRTARPPTSSVASTSRATSAAVAGDDDVLPVADVRHGAHALPLRVVDADLRADVAARVEARAPRRARAPSTSRAARRRDPRLVVVRDDHDARPHVGDHLPQRVGHRPPLVEHALGRVVARVDALARHAVVLGRVPRDQRLPHVVVGEVAVLVVRRVEVGEVARRRASPRPRARRPAPRVPGAREQRRARAA